MNSSNKGMLKFQLKERTALITGSTRGIGWSIARGMAEAGATVYINGRDKKILDTRCKSIIELGYNAKPALFDATDVEATDKFLESTATPIDILVNNAAIRLRKPIDEISPQAFSDVVEANLNSVYAISRSFASRLRNQETKGSLINITSIVGLTGNAGQANYAASKAGLIGMTKSIAKEVASRGITANCIAPGWIETDMTESLPLNSKDDLLDRIPLKRIGKPEDIAYTVLFLASNEASYITGQTITVDGGRVIN